MEKSWDPEIEGFIKANETRWNSSFYCLERVYQLSPILSMVFSELEGKEIIHFYPYITRSLEGLLKLFLPFEEFTRTPQTENDSSLGKVFSGIICLYQRIKVIYFYLFIILNELELRFSWINSSSNSDSLLIIAFLLDLRTYIYGTLESELFKK